VKISYRNERPLTVLYARAFGPYRTAVDLAWRTLGDWLDAQNARPRMRVSYGLFRDNPRVTAPDILRYDACIPLVVGLEEDERAGIRRQILAGGAYAVHIHVGAIEGTGQLFSELWRKEIPARGLKIDDDRAFRAVYLTDPTMTREMNRRTELCVPVLPIRMPLSSNDAGPLLAPDTRSALAGT
jgi:AraC family transcriptional regulator